MIEYTIKLKVQEGDVAFTIHSRDVSRHAQPKKKLLSSYAVSTWKALEAIKLCVGRHWKGIKDD